MRLRGILFILILAGAGLAIGLPMAYPDVLSPHRYHPRAIYYRLRGITVHPLVPIRPEKMYSLEIWETDWPVLGPGNRSYKEFLDGIINEFRTRYPNVIINWTLFPFGENIEAKLKTALRELQPPDIYIGPFNPEVVTSGLGVPLTVFLPREKRPVYEPMALQLVTHKKDLWAWPRWLEVFGWAGNAVLLRAVGVNVETIIAQGWTWDEFLAIARKVTQGNENLPPDRRIYGLVLDNSRPDAFEHLLLNDGVSDLVTSSGNPGWKESQLQETMNFLEKLRNENIFPPFEADMSQELLKLFWEGRAAVIGPVGPPLLRHLLERWKLIGSKRTEFNQTGQPTAGTGEVEPVMLPVPHRTPGFRATPGQVVALHVFRRPEKHERGRQSEDERARLAVELARFLGLGDGAWLAAKLRAIPAYRPDQTKWAGEFQLGPLGRAFVRESVKYNRQTAPGSPDNIERINLLREKVITPALNDFWCGGGSIEETAGRIDREGRRLLIRRQTNNL